LCRERRSFKPYPSEHDLVKQARKNHKNHVTLTRKFHWKSCPTTHSYFLPRNFTILGLFAKPFPTERKRSKCPTQKMGEKQKKWGGEKAKGKRRGGREPFKAKNSQNLLSVHARTSKTVIWPQE